MISASRPGFRTVQAAPPSPAARRWRHDDITGYSGTDLFSPCGIAAPLAALIAGDLPDTAVLLGL
jgi:hypothetical protein